MSTRQKSFFDQPPAKQKPYIYQWHRNNYNHNHSHSHPHHPSRDNPTAPPQRQLATGPPIMPSSQTRSKLKKFQFIDGEPTVERIKVCEAEKENVVQAPKVSQTFKANTVVVKSARMVEEAGKSAEAPYQAPRKLLTPRHVTSRTCPPPSTPATRIPLSELVGNVDDPSRQYVRPIVSPEEQLFWRGSQPINTPVHKRKRARSSSPATPRQQDLAASKPAYTPQPDPAQDLWNRYTDTKDNNKAVAFAHLISDASPRSSATAGSVSGLRRWNSCGVEFPASVQKKRRITGAFKSIKEPEGGTSCLPSSEGKSPVKSKLLKLMEKMRESLPCASPPESQYRDCAPPASSSPLPEPDCEAPIGNEALPQRHSRQSSVQHSSKYSADDDIYSLPTRKSAGSSDEFGDDDFDVDMVYALEASTLSSRPPQSSLPSRAEPTRICPSPQVPLAPPANAEDSDDEFGLDEDDFAADFEQVASLYDARGTESSKEQRHVSGLADESMTIPSNVPAAPCFINLVDDDDEFGDGIDADEFAAAEIAATQAPLTTDHNPRAIQRYLIKSIDEGSWTTERGHQMPQKILLVEEEKTKLFKVITLRQAWYDTPCTPESFVHVIGEFWNTGECVIDDYRNMLILHPDHLLSATVVADSFGCLRRAVLQDRIKATSKANPAMLYGTLLHELFQEALKVNCWDTDFLLGTIDLLLPAKFETILDIEATCEEVKAHMTSKLPELQSWAKIFVRADPRSDAIVREHNGKQSIMSVNKLLDVEEHVWSPMYGLKGNIDATVQVTMQDDRGERTLTVPFEVKTGKNSSNAAHVAQTALYNLLLSNRYDVDVAYGILYYLETSDISRIPAIRNDIIHMIIKRNELACFVRDRIELPPILKEDFKCQKCYAQEPCFLYNKLVEDGQGESVNKKAKERYDELVKSLKPSDQEFMKKWDMLLTKEETDMRKFRRELWTMLSEEREKLGRCFSNVILEPGSEREEKNGQKINRYSYTFIKPRAKAGFSFTESQLIVGEPVVVSDEEGHFALANGYITNVRKRRITVAVDRRLHNSRSKLPGFNSQINQTFVGIMEVSKEGTTIPKYETGEEPVSYRLDKDEFSNGMAAARNNLIQIMNDDVYRAKELRSLIVDGRAPAFKPMHEAIPLPHASQMSMNADQKAAISNVISAKDCALVLGMPGTGKTTTIAHIIRTLAAQGKSVLLTSYTHTAVDNILLKLRDDNISILRLGAAAKIHPDVRQFATLAADTKDSLEELRESWMDPPVVATTCLTINHPLFNQRVFDYCIVDEASQITLPVCLGPIRMAQKFILVGDHYQLPPLVQNKEAQEGGLDVSLFKLLCEKHPEAVTSLEHQYRMCNDIMLLSNTFIYSGRLKCGTASVATRQLTLPNPTGLQIHHLELHSTRAFVESACAGPASPSCWLSRTLSPSAPVVFINTDSISTTLETQSGPRTTNTLEARLVTQLTVSLLSLGVSASEIGVIAFYRSQLALLRSSLASAHTQTQAYELAAPVAGPGATAVELHTADKFQGRDKEVVIVSCVRSNENGMVGDLLKDRRRVNVALTRARSKLIILGSEKTLSVNELLRDIVSLCREKGWVLDLAQDMVDGHAFDEGIIQTNKTPTMSRHRSQFPAQMQTKSPAPSPTKKRKALGDVTVSGSQGNMQPQKRSKDTIGTGSPKARMKMPGKVCTAGKRGVLEGRPVLGNVLNEAI